MAFPFLFLALSLTAGILFASWFSVPGAVWLAVLLVGLMAAWALWLKSKKALAVFVALLIAVFGLGACLYSTANRNYDNHRLHDINEPDYIDLIGTLYKSPARGQDRNFLYLKVTKIHLRQKELDIKGKLRISVLKSLGNDTLHGLFAGDRIKVSARLSILQDYNNFQKRSSSQYLKGQGLLRLAFTKSSLLVEKIKSGKSYSPAYLISQIRVHAQNQIEKYFFDSNNSTLSNQGAVLEALLLGERRRLNTDTLNALQKSGLFHLFAISGAHIAILSFFLFQLFRLLLIPPRISYGIIIGVLIIYALLVEGRPSVLRATLMTSLYLLGKILWNDVNLINTIALSAFVLLFFNPFHLYDLGFQLTFVATLSILLFFPKIMAQLPVLPFRLTDLLAVTLAAHLGILPFMATVFNRITFAGFLLNYAAVPLVAVIMAGGHLFLFFSLLSPTLASMLVSALKICVALFLHVAHFSDKIPFLSYRIPTPHIITCLGYYGFLLSVLLPCKFQKQKCISVCGSLLFFFILILYPFPSQSQYLRVTLIDVGQGDSILVEFPGQEKMLIDGGGILFSSFDVGERVVSPFLWRKGIKKIDYLVLTHLHPDHLIGLLSIAQNFQLQEFWHTHGYPQRGHYQKLYDLLPEYVSKIKLYQGYSRAIQNVTIEALHPPRSGSRFSAENNNQSLVLRISYGETSFLMTGDIEIEAEKEILKHNSKIQSLVLKSPHHGSPSSSSEAFLNAVSPKLILISVGKNNPYGLPHKSTIQKYQNRHAAIYRTDLHGAIEITSDGNSLFLRTASAPDSMTVFPANPESPPIN